MLRAQKDPRKSEEDQDEEEEQKKEQQQKKKEEYLKAQVEVQKKKSGIFNSKRSGKEEKR